VNGRSPYERATYRYTPILAYLMTPNILLSNVFGKFLFVFADLGVAYYIQKIGQFKQFKRIDLCIASWLFNPLSLSISTRGSADSIMCFLVLMFTYLLQSEQHVDAGLVFGLAVHFKIYPVIYGPTIALNLLFIKWQWRNVFKLLKFGVTAVMILVLLTAMFYRLYGFDFLYETYLYHLVRKDHRHNFSAYFYFMYLSFEEETSSWVSLMAFLPQLMIQLCIAACFFKDIPFSFFLQTFAFVTFNKVCTSQYFLWYISLLPVITPSLDASISNYAMFLTLWAVGQLNWLYWAYQLEFQGHNTFFEVWLSSIIFLILNTYILGSFILNYKGITTDFVNASSKHRKIE
jgi:phosphatidylinositol glycan class M